MDRSRLSPITHLLSYQKTTHYHAGWYQLVYKFELILSTGRSTSAEERARHPKSTPCYFDKQHIADQPPWTWGSITSQPVSGIDMAEGYGFLHRSSNEEPQPQAVMDVPRKINPTQTNDPAIPMVSWLPIHPQAFQPRGWLSGLILLGHCFCGSPSFSGLRYVIPSSSGGLPAKARSERRTPPDVMYTMDNHAELPENRTQQLPIQHIANFSYPRTDFVHLYHRIPSDARDSRGPESSPPPMVEDHGSDMSADDDSQYLATGPDFWDSRHAREHEARKPDYPALIKPPPGTQSSKPAITQENPRMSDPSSWGSQSSPVIRPAAVGSFSDKEAHVPQPPPKVSYSLFPPPCPAQRRPPVRSQIPSVPRQSRLEPSPHSLDFPPTPNSRSAIADGKGNAISSFGPGSPQTATPRSAHGGSIAASSSNSIPLLLRSPGPTPPDSPGGTSSSFEAPRSSDAPRYPVRLRTSSPSQREFPLSKNATRSTPSLASHAKAHQQGHAPDAHDKPLTRADLYARPLPPLPTEPPPPLVSPPHVSVFEPDSDDEDEELDSRPGSGDSKNFARRFMHGLVHHHYHHDKKGKGLLPDHKRSVSDEGPSSSLEDRNCGSSMSGIYRTINVARHRRGGAVEAASAARCAVSMDLPRDVAGNHQDQQTAEGPERHGRFWAAKESGEMLLGKILMRKG